MVPVVPRRTNAFAFSSTRYSEKKYAALHARLQVLAIVVDTREQPRVRPAARVLGHVDDTRARVGEQRVDERVSIDIASTRAAAAASNGVSRYDDTVASSASIVSSRLTAC